MIKTIHLHYLGFPTQTFRNVDSATFTDNKCVLTLSGDQITISGWDRCEIEPGAAPPPAPPRESRISMDASPGFFGPTAASGAKDSESPDH